MTPLFFLAATVQIAKTPEYLAMCNDALHTYNDAAYLNKIKQIVKKAGLNHPESFFFEEQT